MDTTSEQNNIGHERIRAYLKECQKATPKGVSIKCVTTGGRGYLQLRFAIARKEYALSCNCHITMQGITEAANKAVRVAEALKQCDTHSEFLDWYDREIRPKNKVRNDLITFGAAIAEVETAFWKGTDKKRNKRDRASVSQQATYHSVYGRFYALLPVDKLFNSKDLLCALGTKAEGTKVYGDCLYAFRKLATTTKQKQVIDELFAIEHTQTQFRQLQNAELETFLLWMKNCLIQAGERYYHRRKQWLWVFSMQLVYGLRVHEVFAIANIDKSFRTPDGVTIPALRDISNIRMIVVVGDVTSSGTTTKTGYRLSAPMLPPSHPNLISELDIRGGELPELNVVSTNPKVICEKYSHSAGLVLKRWNAPITQTHALRHLANQNGKQAGITAEDRAANLGHSVAMNTATYLKREATNTRIAAIDAMSSRMLPLEGAIAVLRRIGATSEAIALTAEIYGVSIGKVRGEVPRHDIATVAKIP
ncbi:MULTISPECIES: hypothetical protein [unclassified Microcoleus]|uniref:hypothetical protein n=1 Tax=unclassified Microcoleus TaxID=2642155 RepID=UPI002FD15751